MTSFQAFAVFMLAVVGLINATHLLQLAKRVRKLEREVKAQ
jgi:hypothetical protein